MRQRRFGAPGRAALSGSRTVKAACVRSNRTGLGAWAISVWAFSSVEALDAEGRVASGAPAVEATRPDGSYRCHLRLSPQRLLRSTTNSSAVGRPPSRSLSRSLLPAAVVHQAGKRRRQSPTCRCAEQLWCRDLAPNLGSSSGACLARPRCAKLLSDASACACGLSRRLRLRGSAPLPGSRQSARRAPRRRATMMTVRARCKEKMRSA